MRRFRLVATTILTLILAGVMSAIGFSNAFAASSYGFIDVDPDAWYATDEVLGYAIDHGFIRGYDDGRLGPDDSVTRGQVATILHRLAGEPEAESTAFEDVNYLQYYGPAIRWARATGVITGYGDPDGSYRRFGPDDPVSREQLCSMLARYAKNVGELDISSNCKILESMPDATNVSSWARNDVGWAMDKRIVTGDITEGVAHVNPQGKALRCQMAKMVSVFHRDVLGKVVKLTFNLNYDGAPAAKTAVIGRGECANEPEPPTRAGYVFTGWYTESSGGEKFDFKTTVSESRTLYARWQTAPSNTTPSTPSTPSNTTPSTPSTKFVVTFDGNGENVSNLPLPQQVEAGSHVAEPAKPIRNGFVFEGWYSDVKLTKAFDFTNQAISENTTLYAKWADDYGLPPSTGISEGDIAVLSTSRTEFEVGPDQQTTLRLQSTLAVDHAVASVAGSGESFPMYDDGDLGAHGDDIAGDGVYSALYTVDCSKENLDGIEITGTITIGSQSLASEPVALYVVAPFTDAELGLMATVDQAISDVMQGEGFDAKPLPDQAAAVRALLERLASDDPGIGGYDSPLVVEGSVKEEGATAVSFKYAVKDGVEGGVLLKDRDGDTKEGDAGRQAGSAERMPAEAEAWTEIEPQGSSNSKPLKTLLLHNFLNEGSSTSGYEQGWVNNYHKCVYGELDSRSEIDEKKATTIDTYKHLDGYDVIIVNSHGIYWGNDPAIILGEQATKAADQAYSTDIVTRRVVKMNTKEEEEVYLLLPKFFEDYYDSRAFEGAIVYLGLCEGYGNDVEDADLAKSFTHKGAAAVYAYCNSVGGTYDYDMLEDILHSLASGSTTQAALDDAKQQNGKNDGQGKDESGKDKSAWLNLHGDRDKVLHDYLQNGGFDDLLFRRPSLSHWRRSGDTRAVVRVGGLKPESLFGMALITTGMGASNSQTTSTISQTCVIPENASTLTFHYDFISEEPLEYVGSIYNDTFIATLTPKRGDTIRLVTETINESKWFPLWGINFTGGDDTVYHTRWSQSSTDISSLRGQTVTLTFTTYDRGDTIYDSATLIDSVSIS